MEKNISAHENDPNDHHSSDWVYNKLDKNQDGQVTKAEFMEMAPSILKEAMFASEVPSQQSMK
jgi:hypothetical protein